ncbi:MAG: Crp/Fnr family transcriptional regulator [Bacteroidales bacterium]|jgi:CRP/FNR family transcriptional regulator|nr:Crp/Fnr family transcriptional regulator [Bacteroidales bacterium]
MSEQNLINSCETCTAGWKNFRHISREEMKVLNSNRYEATFKPGEIMIKQGSPASVVLFMSTGLAKSYVEGLNGKNFILRIEKPGNLIMGPGSYANSRFTHSVSAITTVHACFVSSDAFRKFTVENPSFAEGLVDTCGEAAVKMQARMVNLAQKRMSGRLADVLLYFADEIFHSDEYEMILSRQELGEMTSMAKECVVRLLKEFEESGVINSDVSGIKILDRERLVKISEQG